VSDSTALAHGQHDAPDHGHEEHPAYLRHHFENVEQQADAAGFAMWLFLLTEVMFFGGMFTAYLIYRNWYYPAFVEASHQLNIFWAPSIRWSSSRRASPWPWAYGARKPASKKD